MPRCDNSYHYRLLRRAEGSRNYTLNITRAGISDLLHNPDWYKLSIPPEALELHSMGQVRLWQEIAVTLLKKYCDTFYKFKKSEFEAPHLEYRDLELDPERNPNLIEEYSTQSSSPRRPTKRSPTGTPAVAR